jgi:hypothetical protein
MEAGSMAPFKPMIAGKNVIITTVAAQKSVVFLDDIVFLKGLKSDFWSRLNCECRYRIKLHQSQ